MQRFAQLILLAVLTTSATAGAQPRKPKALTAEEEAYAAHMTNGVRLFETQDYPAAIAEFEAAYRATPKASPLINQALCYRELKRYPIAVEKLELALSKHSDTMDANDKAAAKKLVDDLRALFAYLTIVVKGPAEAKVAIDGIEVGTEALSASGGVAVSPGEHVISVEAEGFSTQAKKVSVVSGNKVEVDFELVLARATLRVVAVKPTTVIEIDGVPKATGSWQGELPAGSHTVRAVGETGLGTIELGGGATVIIDLGKGSIALPPLPASPTIPDPPEVKPDPDAPKRGFFGHLNAGLLVPVRHPRRFFDSDPSSGGYVGLRVGYRVGTYAAFEGMAEYGNVEGPANGAGSKTYSLSSIRFGPGLRIMSPGELIHFVGTLGGGLAYHIMNYEDLNPTAYPTLCKSNKSDCGTSGVDFYAQFEVGAELEFEHVLIGLSLAAYLSSTKGMEDFQSGAEATEDADIETNVRKPYDNALLVMLGPRIHIGYAFW